MPKSVIAGIGVFCLTAAFAMSALQAKAQERALSQSVSTQKRIVAKAAATQKRINQLANQTRQMLASYMQTEQQVDQLKKYNSNLQKLISNQQQRISSLNKQMGQISGVEHGIVPLMEEMIAGLKQFIDLDVPYQLKQRRATVQKLQALMTNSDVSIAEKYRQIMNAYQNEISDGRTIDSYRAELKLDGHQQTVNFLRVGRIVLCYQTLDQSQTGCWNQRKHEWQPMNGFRSAVQSGLRIARKQVSPNLIILPVPAPESAK